MPQHGDSLLSLLSQPLFFPQPFALLCVVVMVTEMMGNQRRIRMEHGKCAFVSYVHRLWTHRTECSEKTSIIQHDRHRNITIQLVGSQYRMIPVCRFASGVIHGNTFAALPDLIT